MYFDALTLAAVADELRESILGGRIQRVVLPSPLSIGLEVYAHHQRYQVLASAHPQFARIHLVQRKPSRGVEQATPLLLLLRKYIVGGRIIAIDQPPLERILIVSIAKDGLSRNSAPAAADDDDAAGLPAADGESLSDDDHKQPLHSELIIEPMERRSNIMLVGDNNIILDSVKRVTPRMSQRVVLPNQPYEFPPRQQKRDPRTATAEGIAALRDLDIPDLARALVAGYQGLSPQAAREILQRAIGQPQATMADTLPWEGIAASMRALFSSAWEPTLVQDEEQQVAYAPYRLTHLPGAAPQPGISSALEAFYEAREGWAAHQQRRAAVQQQLDTTRQRLQHQHQQITSELASLDNGERLRWEGEMIFAFLHTITAGQSTLEVEGQTITLESGRTAVESAQARFQAYHKARSGRERLLERQRATDIQLAGLEQLSALLEVADEREQIEQIVFEAEQQGYLLASARKPDQRKQKVSPQRRPIRRKPLHLVSSNGFDIYVGRSAVQNDEVTFRIGRPDDLWLHARAIHGAHVIVRSSGRAVPDQTLKEAAGLAAYFSRARHTAAVDVEISYRRQVRKVAGGAPGLVTYRAERTLRVAPLPPWG